MTNLEYFNEIGETNLSAEDTALGMVLSEFKNKTVNDVNLGSYDEDNDDYSEYIKRYHCFVKWLNEEKK